MVAQGKCLYRLSLWLKFAPAKGNMCKLKKSLYDLKQSLRVPCDLFSQWLAEGTQGYKDNSTYPIRCLTRTY